MNLSQECVFKPNDSTKRYVTQQKRGFSGLFPLYIDGIRLVKNALHIRVGEDSLGVHGGTDLAEGVKLGVILSARFGRPEVYLGPVGASVERLHELLKGFEVSLVGDVLTVRTVHDDSNPARVTSIRR